MKTPPLSLSMISCLKGPISLSPSLTQFSSSYNTHHGSTLGRPTTSGSSTIATTSTTAVRWLPGLPPLDGTGSSLYEGCGWSFKGSRRHFRWLLRYCCFCIQIFNVVFVKSMYEKLYESDNNSDLVTKAHSNEGITPSHFINCLLRDFGQQVGPSSSSEDGRNSIAWKDIGLAVSHVIKRAPGCCTMLGPMNTEPKQRKVVVHRKRVRQTESAWQPEQVVQDDGEL